MEILEDEHRRTPGGQRAEEVDESLEKGHAFLVDRSEPPSPSRADPPGLALVEFGHQERERFRQASEAQLEIVDRGRTSV